MCERERTLYIVDSLISPERAVERFKNRSNVMKFRSFGDTSSIVKDKLKTIRLCSR